MNRQNTTKLDFNRLVSLLLAIGIVSIAPCAAFADGTEILGTPTIPISSGTGIVSAGVGTADSQPANIVIDVPAGASVQQAILYWAGTNLGTAELTLTDTIQVNGGDVIGEFIGGNTLYSGTDGINAEVTVAYRADITGLNAVADGPSTNTVSVSGFDFTEENDGAGILVIYDDGSPASQIDVRDGNDFAMINWPPTLDEIVPQRFDFPSANVDRVGIVDLFVASVSDDTGVYGFRPSSFEIEVAGVTAVFSDQLNSVDGRYWDTVNLVVTIPAGADELEVRVFSRDDEFLAPGNLPASLVVETAGFAVLTPPKDLCWITTGGFHNAGEQAGGKDFTFGGNVGPPPRGSWEVVDHNTGDNFHSNDVHIVSCEVINLTGPGQPGGKKGFKINQANFEGTGRLNGVHGYPFTGYVQDAGEPSGKKANDQDYFSITVRDPDTTAIVFEASATLDGGNVQIHPPTGKKGGGKKN
jgi:hypothetical protein